MLSNFTLHPPLPLSPGSSSPCLFTSPNTACSFPLTSLDLFCSLSLECSFPHGYSSSSRLLRVTFSENSSLTTLSQPTPFFPFPIFFIKCNETSIQAYLFKSVLHKNVSSMRAGDMASCSLFYYSHLFLAQGLGLRADIRFHRVPGMTLGSF